MMTLSNLRDMIEPFKQPSKPPKHASKPPKPCLQTLETSQTMLANPANHASKPCNPKQAPQKDPKNTQK